MPKTKLTLYLSNYNEIQSFDVVYTNKKYHFIDREKTSHELYAVGIEDLDNEKKFDGWGFFSTEKKAYEALTKFNAERIKHFEKMQKELLKNTPTDEKPPAK